MSNHSSLQNSEGSIAFFLKLASRCASTIDSLLSITLLSGGKKKEALDSF